MYFVDCMCTDILTRGLNNVKFSKFKGKFHINHIYNKDNSNRLSVIEKHRIITKTEFEKQYLNRGLSFSLCLL